MNNSSLPTRLFRLARRRWLVCSLLPVLACAWLVFSFRTAQATPAGEADAAQVLSQPPAVKVVRPTLRTITRVVGQPSFVESYERTSIYPKVTGYLEKWNVDIGDTVKKGQTLATIFVPELREDWVTKKRTVTLDQDRVRLARRAVEVAEADVRAAKAHLQESRDILAKYQSQVDRWTSEVQRLRREVKRGVVDPQVLLESENQLKESTAARNAARATIEKADAELLSRRNSLAEDKVAVDVARDQVGVAESDAKRVEAWVGYLTLTAPFDGKVVARNANTGDFVMPLTGDPSADHNAPHLSPSGKAAPVYVIDRTDVVRIFVDIPEADANYVHPGSRASVLVRGFRDEWIPATVTRTSWALNVKSRTLRAEIDLRNTDRPDAYHDGGAHDIAAVPSQNGVQILPGMYAYGKVIIERPRVWALPESALHHVGEQTYYWGYENGHAVKVEVQTGISDGEWVEVTNRQAPPQGVGESPWKPINGSERVIVGDCASLSNGAAVRLANAPVKGEANRPAAASVQRRAAATRTPVSGP